MKTIYRLLGCVTALASIVLFFYFMYFVLSTVELSQATDIALKACAVAISVRITLALLKPKLGKLKTGVIWLVEYSGVREDKYCLLLQVWGKTDRENIMEVEPKYLDFAQTLRECDRFIILHGASWGPVQQMYNSQGIKVLDFSNEHPKQLCKPKDKDRDWQDTLGSC